MRASTGTIAWKAWHGSFGRTAPGPRDSSRAASFMALPGALTLTSSSRSSGCIGGLSFFAEFSGFTLVLSHRNGRPFGTCWKLFRCGGCVVGRVDEDGEFTGICRSFSQIISYFGNLGPDIAYLYPDLSTALVGNFKSGDLVTGQVSSLISVRLDYGAIQVVILKEAPRK